MHWTPFHMSELTHYLWQFWKSKIYVWNSWTGLSVCVLLYVYVYIMVWYVNGRMSLAHVTLGLFPQFGSNSPTLAWSIWPQWSAIVILKFLGFVFPVWMLVLSALNIDCLINLETVKFTSFFSLSEMSLINTQIIIDLSWGKCTKQIVFNTLNKLSSRS